VDKLLKKTEITAKKKKKKDSHENKDELQIFFLCTLEKFVLKYCIKKKRIECHMLF